MVHFDKEKTCQKTEDTSAIKSGEKCEWINTRMYICGIPKKGRVKSVCIEKNLYVGWRDEKRQNMCGSSGVPLSFSGTRNLSFFVIHRYSLAFLKFLNIAARNETRVPEEDFLSKAEKNAHHFSMRCLSYNTERSDVRSLETALSKEAEKQVPISVPSLGRGL